MAKPLAGKKKANAPSNVSIFMCCSVNFVTLRFDQATFGDTVLSVDPATVKTAPMIAVSRVKGLMAHLKYVVNGIEYAAKVTQDAGGPGKPGDPLPKGLKNL